MNQIEHPLDGRLSQRHYYEEACDPEFEIARPHDCGRLYQFLIDHKFQTGLAMLGLELTGKTVLEVDHLDCALGQDEGMSQFSSAHRLLL